MVAVRSVTVPATGAPGARGDVASLRLGRTVSSVSEYAGSVWLLAVPLLEVSIVVAPLVYDDTTGTAPSGVKPVYRTPTVCALSGSRLTSSTARSPFGRRDACALTSGFDVPARTSWSPVRANDDIIVSAWYGANGVFIAGSQTEPSAVQLPLESSPKS